MRMGQLIIFQTIELFPTQGYCRCMGCMWPAAGGANLTSHGRCGGSNETWNVFLQTFGKPKMDQWQSWISREFSAEFSQTSWSLMFFFLVFGQVFESEFSPRWTIPHGLDMHPVFDGFNMWFLQICPIWGCHIWRQNPHHGSIGDHPPLGLSWERHWWHSNTLMAFRPFSDPYRTHPVDYACIIFYHSWIHDSWYIPAYIPLDLHIIYIYINNTSICILIWRFPKWRYSEIIHGQRWMFHGIRPPGWTSDGMVNQLATGRDVEHFRWWTSLGYIYIYIDLVNGDGVYKPTSNWGVPPTVGSKTQELDMWIMFAQHLGQSICCHHVGQAACYHGYISHGFPISLLG